MDENNRGLLIVLGILVLVVLIAPSVGGMLAPVGAPSTGPLGTPTAPQGPTPAPGEATTPGAVSGLTSGLAAGLSSLSMLALWGVLVVGVVLLVVRLGGATFGGPAESAEDPAFSTLRRRYAAGEISQEEYEQMRQVLER